MKLNFEAHLGIFGGSFDPPHFGHQEAVKGLIKDLNFSQILVVPSFGTPLKTVTTSFEDRFHMTELAFQNIPRVTVSRVEQSEKIQFSYQLLSILSSSHPKLAMIIGTDQFEKLQQWARFPDLLTLCDWVVLLRKTKEPTPFIQKDWLFPTQHENQFLIKNGKKQKTFTFIPTQAGPISSTLVRQKFTLGHTEAIAPLIPASVLNYIESRKLYGT